MKNNQSYNPSKIESESQNLWSESKIYKAVKNDKEKFYALGMFPYPSGTLHMGHIRNYTLADVVARYNRLLGKNVLNPIGWDSFGLPAENAAAKNDVSPKDWTISNILDMKSQLKQMGYSYDWDKELTTFKEDYYKWEQWLFIKLYEKGLVYKKKAIVNWDPVDETVLANEQVINGRGWRSNALVEKKKISQWFIKITDYAEELLSDLDKLKNWPDAVKLMQKNWIGKSEGLEIDFKLETLDDVIKVYTTRADTIYGVSNLFIAPDSPLAKKLATSNKAIDEFVKKTNKLKASESDLETQEKLGIDTGLSAIHPLTNSKVSVWIANYVLAEYGTGAIMSVPAHCKRDFEIAKKYNLPIKKVIKSDADLYEEQGELINSGEYSGLSSKEAIEKIKVSLQTNKKAEVKINYRLRDWGVSRQRYWGTPIPMVDCENCGIVPETNLPVKLPEVTSVKPLAMIESFYKTKCPKCNNDAKRDTDTMDTFVNSSWYYLRFASLGQDESILDENADYWCPVDYYIGGVEHAVMHLLYARFFHKIIRDLGFVKTDEPFDKLLTLGMVHKDGAKMSKQKGNVVSPKKLIDKYGADTIRLYTIFAAPPEQSLEWSDSGIAGCYKFLNKLFNFANSIPNDIFTKVNQNDVGNIIYDKNLIEKRKQIFKIFKKIDFDYKRSQFNTVVSSCMSLLNLLDVNTQESQIVSCEALKIILLSLEPITPHICQNLWTKYKENSFISDALWPKIPVGILDGDNSKFVIQINGKLKDSINIEKDLNETQIIELVKNLDSVLACNEKIIKIIIVKNRNLINVVMKK